MAYYSPRRVAGLLLAVAAAQFSVGLIWAAARYPGYSIADNYISDLGVGPAAPLFNGSVILLGALVIVAAYYVQQAFRRRAFTGVLVLLGVGGVGVGVFTEDFGSLHWIFSAVALSLGGVAAVAAAFLVRAPFRYFSLGLGVVSLVALGLFVAGAHLGLGVGGMERMIVYPILAWGMTYGGHLMGVPRQARSKEPRPRG